MADETPSKLVYIQGGNSTISNGSEGMMVITVKDIIPYFYLTDDNTSRLVPMTRVTRFNTPLNAAVISSSPSNEIISMIQVSNLSLSDENTTLTLYANPISYYDGSLLKSFANKQKENVPDLTGEFKNTQIYAEAGLSAPTNTEVGCQPGEIDCCYCASAPDCWGCYDPVTGYCYDW